MLTNQELKAYATDRQIEILDAFDKYGSHRKTATALGLSKSAVSESIARVRRKAMMHSYDAGDGITVKIDEPYIIKGTSQFYKKGVLKHGWVKTQLDQDKYQQAIKEMVASMVEGVRGLSPIIPPPQFSNDDLMCVYPMGDPHFGLYAWAQDAGDDFDLKIAEELTCSAIDRLVNSAPNAETALLLNLGDMFHADNQKNMTNSGHQLDVDGRWAKVQQVGLKAMLHCINRLLEKHQTVIFRINKGNHDGHSSYALALMISCYYDKEPRVKVDLSPAISWYYQFGKNLIGSTHGDTIRGADMLGVMAADVPQMWGETEHRVWYVGHVHHQDTKEYRGGVVEYFRTIAARDAWHTGQGYRAGRDMRLIVLHKTHGEIERHRCDIGMLK